MKILDVEKKVENSIDKSNNPKKDKLREFLDKDLNPKKNEEIVIEDIKDDSRNTQKVPTLNTNHNNNPTPTESIK